MCLGLKSLNTILMSGQGEALRRFPLNEWTNRGEPKVKLESAKVGRRGEKKRGEIHKM